MNKLILPTLALVFCSSLSIAATDSSGFFIGAEAQFMTTDDEENNENLTSSGVGINAGYYFTPYIGLEASYGLTDDLIYDDSFEHYDLTALGRLPITDSFSAYLGAGFAVYDAEFLPKSQLGLIYNLNSNLALNAGYTFYGKPDKWNDHLESFDVGFTYFFGHKASVEVQEVESTQPRPVSDNEAAVVIEPIVKKEVNCRTNIVEQNYTVQKDDWLWKIARHFNMTVSDFYQLNSKFIHELDDLNIIHPGAVVLVSVRNETCSAVGRDILKSNP